MSEFDEGSVTCWKPARATFAIPPGRSDHECNRAVGKAYGGPVSSEQLVGFQAFWQLPLGVATAFLSLSVRTSSAGVDDISAIYIRCAELLAVCKLTCLAHHRSTSGKGCPSVCAQGR